MCETLVIYIHNNPVKHGFTKSPEEWTHSSYNKIINNNSKIICLENIIRIFNDTSNFKFIHKNRLGLFTEEDLED